jgi:D-aminopeptidase
MTSRLAVTIDEKAIDSLFQSVDQSRLPGVAVGIAVDGVPVYRRGFGLASMELPVTLTPSIRMRIGSTSKHFTALAYLLLCEEERATLEDPIGRYIPELHDSARNVTMRQLMTHTSGLRDVFDVVMQFNGLGQGLRTDELLAYYRDIDDVGFSPHSSWSYNNGGYLLLSVAIERITGKSLEEVLRQRIFEPVGMQDTMLRRWDCDFVPNSATLHMMDARGQYHRAPAGMALSGEGGIVSSIDDMLRWLRHMDQPRIGKPETWAALRHPEVLTNGTSTRYGLGLMLDGYRGARTLFHGGGLFGGNAQMMKVLDAGLDIVVISNRQDAWAPLFTNRIIDESVSGLDDKAATHALPKVHAHYLSPASGRLVGIFTDGAIPTLSIDGMESPADALGPHTLSYAAPLDFYQVSVHLADEAIPPESIELTDFGNKERLDLIRPRSNPIADEAPVGKYRAETIGVDAIIEDQPDGLQLQFHGRHGSERYRLERLAPHVWKARSLGSIPLFGGIVILESAGRGFRFSSSRSRNLRFVSARSAA